MSSRMREHILSVASDLFSSQGINATSVDKIVAKAQIAKVTLYNHFKTKEILIVEYLRDQDAKLWSKFGGKENADGGIAELHSFLNEIFDYIADKDFKGFASINAAVEFPESEHIVNQTSKELSKQLRTRLIELAEKAGFKNSEALAMQLQFIIEGASISNHKERNPETIEHAKAMTRILIDSQ